MSESIQIASKWLKDVNDVNFFPVTHINAVRDENNDPLSTLLDRKQDTITTDNKLNWDLVDHPTIPTVNNATLTIQRNGVLQGTFTANASSNKTINIPVPVTASDVSALPSNTKYGASLNMTLDSSTYVLTVQLKDQDGNNLGDAKTADLPLESMVTGGSYNNSTKKITLTQQGGSNVDIDISGITSGLQPTINSSNKLSADYISDGTTNKAYTATEKTKLNGIETGAEVNVQSDWNVVDNSLDSFIKNKPTIGNGTLTIWQNQTSKGTFTANQNTASDITITVPTKTSDLTNDGDGTHAFLTQHQDISGKQDTLVSGTNIKTINGSSVLGSGDLTVETSSLFECEFTLTPRQGVEEPNSIDDYTVSCNKTPEQIYEAYDDGKIIQGVMSVGSDPSENEYQDYILDLLIAYTGGTSPSQMWGVYFLLDFVSSKVIITGIQYPEGVGPTSWTLFQMPTLPSGYGTSGQVLVTNGSDGTSWANIEALPDQTGQSGKFLTTNGLQASWATVDALPSQTGNNGKFLTTNGTTASWAEIQGSSITIRNWTYE